MSRDVFLAPCDPGNFDRTVRSPVDARDYPNAPAPVADEAAVRFWGVRDGSSNEATFEKMDAGDLVLFYQDKTYVGTGWIGDTFEDEVGWASTTFWRDAPSRLVYTVTDFTPVSVPRNAVNTIFDYVDDYYPQGLMRVAENRVGRRPAVIKRGVEKYSERHRA